MRSPGPWLTRWHRRFALLGVLPLAVWFLSGLAMPFARYPSCPDASALSGLPPLAVPAPLPVTGCDTAIEIEQLPGGQRGSRCGASGAWRLAGDESPLPRLLEHREAVALAQAHVDAAGAGRGPPALVETLERPDLWTLPSNYLPHFPLLKASWREPEARVVYVSLRTARVVQETDRASRLEAWLGPVPHWLYVTELRRHREPWRWVVMAGALLALLPLLTGVLNGWRVMLRSRPKGLWSRYRRRAWRVHHLLGIGAGASGLAWAFSGLLSVNPAGWSAGLAPTDADLAAWRGGPLPGRKGVGVDDVAGCAHDPSVRRWVVDRVGARRTTRCQSPGRDTWLQDGQPDRLLPAEIAREAVARVLGARGITEPPGPPARVDHDDAYLTLPVAAVAQAVWAGNVRIAYDLRSGRLLQVAPVSGRIERWLYQGLHCWDLPFLVRRPFLRRALQLVFLLLGWGLTASGVLLVYRRLADRPPEVRRKKRAQAEDAGTWQPPRRGGD